MIAALAPLFVTRALTALHAVNVSGRELLTTTADVLIVYYVVFRILKLVRGTRAAQTMAGMALLGGVYFLAKRLDLFAVSWLFEKLIDYFIILFVVIFQQDLRRALMQVGQNLFVRRQYEETYVIEEVVQAAGDMAKQRIGALIVIERDADLSEHIGEVGIEMDARVTKELLITLFIPDPQNHMHDGAVIIRNLRLQQAGAVLPLSANAKLDKQFGTRHRAAIGITEETDAVVVVVSEERGAVSLCFNGNIARDLDAATLRKALLGLFQKKKNTKGKPQPPSPKPRRTHDAALDPPIVTDGKPPIARESAMMSQSPLATSLNPEPHGSPVPPELMPLFVTQPMTRPPLPHEIGIGSQEITAPMLSVKEVMAAAEQASDAQKSLAAPTAPAELPVSAAKEAERR